MDIIKTRRLILKKLEREDAKEYFKISHDEKVAMFLSYAYCKDMNEALSFVNSICENTIYKGDFGIINRMNQLIGLVTYEKVNYKTIKFNIFIGEKFRGNSYASEAIQAVKEALQVKSSARNYTVICSRTNASKRMIEKLRGKEVLDDSNEKFQIVLIK